MNTNPNVFARIGRWFDPRGRSLSDYGFILNRITALGLTLYLFLHLIVLGTLAQGPDAYGDFLEIIESPILKFGEWLVVAAVFIHGLNGIRIGLNSLGIGAPRQREYLIGVFVISLLAIVFFGWKIFLG
jgi:succinate dehydrogenase / fumarate reductase cytochrome b subunit